VADGLLGDALREFHGRGWRCSEGELQILVSGLGWMDQKQFSTWRFG
jgi:hypothetical protein